eukprot:767182-Hanusia_phi.AAC.3
MFNTFTPEHENRQFSNKTLSILRGRERRERVDVLPLPARPVALPHRLLPRRLRRHRRFSSCSSTSVTVRCLLRRNLLVGAEALRRSRRQAGGDGEDEDRDKRQRSRRGGGREAEEDEMGRGRDKDGREV